MDGGHKAAVAESRQEGSEFGAVKSAHAPVDDLERAFATISTQIAGAELCLVVLFVSPKADLVGVARHAESAFANTTVVGCTTAGEISSDGYVEGEIVALGLPRSDFVSECIVFDDLSDIAASEIALRISLAKHGLANREPYWASEFAFLMVDGMSLREDQLVSALGPALGQTPLFGGSAGDGLDFRRSYVLANGRFLENAAVLAMVRTRCGVRVFNFDHLRPTETRMVVTEAEPGRRLVREINGEPAAWEYARLVGKDPRLLSPFVFAAHPVVVRLGENHHVRAIQKVEPNGDLRFFSAIDEGLVLTVAEPEDLVSHLSRVLASLSETERPAAIVACDCILRRVEAAQKQKIAALSGLLSDHAVIGFSTYGEQANSVHINQTLTGVAIYPPAEEVSK